MHPPGPTASSPVRLMGGCVSGTVSSVIKPKMIQLKEHQHMRRKILMGVLALALPVGTIAGLSPSAFAGAPDAPISCTGFGGTVTFGGGAGLTQAGTAT